MAIVNVRYDERLIHGQVATFWTSTLGVDRIVVLDSKAAADDMIKMTLRMSVPQGVKSSIIEKEKFLDSYTSGKYGDQRLMIVFRDLHIIEYLLKNNVPIREVNLGNKSKQDDDGIRITNSFVLTKEDAETIRRLHDKGVRIYAQMTPTETETSYNDIMKKVEN